MKDYNLVTYHIRWGGSNARLGGGGQELRLLCEFNQYPLLQNRDNSGVLGIPMYYSLKVGEGGGGSLHMTCFKPHCCAFMLAGLSSTNDDYRSCHVLTL